MTTDVYRDKYYRSEDTAGRYTFSVNKNNLFGYISKEVDLN